jgi:hypothetical protein
MHVVTREFCLEEIGGLLELAAGTYKIADTHTFFEWIDAWCSDAPTNYHCLEGHTGPGLQLEFLQYRRDNPLTPEGQTEDMNRIA